MAVYYSHQHADTVKLDLRLALISHLSERCRSLTPPLSESQFLKKYQNDAPLLLDYWECQDLECFENVGLMLIRIT